MIESRERSRRSHGMPATAFSDWEVCEGTETLNASECKSLVRQWTRDDADTHWLVIEYRIVGFPIAAINAA